MDKRYDLLVAGGGLTGAAAAVAAARRGKKVLLVDKSGFLGGAACNCYVNPFMPFTTGDGKGGTLCLSNGIFTELLERLEKSDGMIDGGGSTFSEECMKLVLDEMTDEAGVDVLLHSTLVDVERDWDRIKSVTVVYGANMMRLEADYFLDATGNADLTAMAGLSCRVGRDSDGLCQPMTLCFRLSGVDVEEMYRFGQENINKAYDKAKEEGRVHNPRENVLLFPHVANGVVHFNTTRVIKKSPIDAWDITAAEKEARRQMHEMYRFLKRDVPAFKNCELLSGAPEIGVRESRMIEAEHTLTENEMKELVRFPDSICVGNYDIDIHSPDGSGTSHYYFAEGEYYTIPYRSLIPRGMKNLLAAGRCLGATHEAQASCRIMPICCCMGEAAGLALSLCADDGCPAPEVDMDALHGLMDERGLLWK